MTVIQFPAARIVRDAPRPDILPEPSDWLRAFYEPIPWYFDWVEKHYGERDLPPTYPRRR